MIEAFCDLIRAGTVDHPWLDLSLKTQQVCDQLASVARSSDRPHSRKSAVTWSMDRKRTHGRRFAGSQVAWS